MSWQGPYEIIWKTRNVTYKIRVPRKGIKLYHVNLLKEWEAWESEAI